MSGNRGKGRPKGAANKTTAQLKDMILQALDGAGGVAYLVRQADENPSAFISLLGRVLPLQINQSDKTIVVTRIEIAGPEPKQHEHAQGRASAEADPGLRRLQ